jgi:IS4 transposase
MRWGIETSFRELKYALGLKKFSFKKGGVHYPINICKTYYV